MAMVGIIFMSFINDCVLYLVSCSFWILKTKIPWMYIRGQDKLDEKSATKIHMYQEKICILEMKSFGYIHSRALGTCKTYIYLHTNRDSIFAESDPQRGKIVSWGTFWFPWTNVFMWFFFYYFHTVYKRSSKNKSCENTAAGKLKKKHIHKDVTPVCLRSQIRHSGVCVFIIIWRVVFERWAPPPSSSYLMICVSSVARNNQLSDCFIRTKQ